MTTTLTIRLTGEERAAVDAAADGMAVGPSTFARRATVEASGKPLRSRHGPAPEAAVLARVLGGLGKIGNLTNQLARHAHQGGRVPEAALATVRSELIRLTEAVLALREEQQR